MVLQSVHIDFLSGVTEIDQILTVLMKTSMAVGCIAALILDNTIPGTLEERGLKSWRCDLSAENDGNSQTASIRVYDLPFCLKRLGDCKAAKYIPFLPYNHSEPNNVYDMEVEYSTSNL